MHYQISGLGWVAAAEMDPAHLLNHRLGKLHAINLNCGKEKFKDQLAASTLAC